MPDDGPLPVEKAREIVKELCAKGVISEKARDSMLPLIDEQMLKELHDRRLAMVEKLKRENGEPQEKPDA